MNWLWRELARAIVPMTCAVGVAALIGTFAIFAGVGSDKPAVVVVIVTLFVLPLGVLLAGLNAVLFGLPLFLLMRRMGLRLHWWSGVLLGTCVAMIPIGYIMLPVWRSFLGDHPMRDWSSWQAFRPAIPFILAGAGGGFAFWRILPNGEARA